MTIHLKLDTAAVAALFPEGSEARLELQQGVINQIVNRLVDRELSSTRNFVADQCKSVVAKALEKEGLTSKLWSGVDLSVSYKEKLQKATKEAADIAFNGFMEEALAPLIADMNKRIKERMEGELNAKLTVLAKEALRGALR